MSKQVRIHYKPDVDCCPYCGGEIKLDEDDFYMFCCESCGAGVTFSKECDGGGAENCNKQESIERFNKRVAYDLDKVVEQLEELHHYACFPTGWVSEEQTPVYAHFREELKKILDTIKAGEKNETN